MAKQAEFDKFYQMYYAGLQLVQLGQISQDLKINKEVSAQGFKMVTEAVSRLSSDYFDEFCGTVPKKFPPLPRPWPWPFPWTDYNKPQPDPSPILLGKHGILEALGQFQKSKLDAQILTRIGEMRGLIEANF